MGARRRILEIAAGAAGVAVAAGAVAIARQGRVIARRGAGDRVRLGSLRSAPHTVVAGDGVPLHVEVDELDRPGSPTLVFVHGYALNLDCWHFQRAAYRGLVRSVFYDQRSHGRSGRSDKEHATIEQLGDDLHRVLRSEVPEGPVVLIGHSMGGMSILALLEQHPELVGDQVVGVGLVSTTAGGLTPHKVFLPLLPGAVGGMAATRLVAALARGARVIDAGRRIGKDVALVATDRIAFGGDVPASYVEFADRMLSGTPFEVLAEFFPSFGTLDKYAALGVLGRVPTTVICGSADKMTPVALSQKVHDLVPGSTLVECQGAGHLVIIERHEQVNAALDQLIAAAQEAVGRA